MLLLKLDEIANTMRGRLQVYNKATNN